MLGGPDPNAILGRYLDKQRRNDQFSEDMRSVMYGGSVLASNLQKDRTGGAASRVRSPGLAAGAALTLGATSSTAQEAHAQCRQAVENARRQTCPFDDHSAFGASSADRQRHARMPVLDQEDVAATQKDARSLGKYNRDISQKTGAGAPFDAPFDTAADGLAPCPVRDTSGSMPVGRSRRSGAPPAMPQEAAGGARAEAVANRTRMRGSEDILGGYLNPWEPQASMMGKEQQAPRSGSLPPRAPARDLLPQAMMSVQYHGGSVKGITCAQTAYLNSKVLGEANRDRNVAGRINFG